MCRRVSLLMILVFLLISHGCAKPQVPRQQEVDFNQICARCYHAQVLELENSPTPEAEEYEVYAAVLEAEFIFTHTERIIIQNGIVEDGIEVLLESAVYAAEALTVTDNLLDDFRAKNQEVYHFENNFDLDAPVILLNREEICQILEGADWDNFHSQYPHSGGLKEFSRVAFNAEQTEALVYIGNTAWALMGWGQFVLLTKDGEKWVVIGRHITWIS
jgi:hypothetical protein